MRKLFTRFELDRIDQLNVLIALHEEPQDDVFYYVSKHEHYTITPWVLYELSGGKAVNWNAFPTLNDLERTVACLMREKVDRK